MRARAEPAFFPETVTKEADGPPFDIGSVATVQPFHSEARLAWEAFVDMRREMGALTFRRRLLFLYLPAFVVATLVVPLIVLVRAWADPGPSVHAEASRVILNGPIEPHTAPQFMWAIKRAKHLGPPGAELVIELNSPGGALTAAESMGWALRRAADDGPVRAVVPAGAACQSACTVVFMAADRREVDPTSHFMFHLPDAPEGASPSLRWVVRAIERVFQGYTRMLEDASPALVRYLVSQGVFHYRLDCHLFGAELGRAFPEFTSVRAITPTIHIPPEQHAISTLIFRTRHTCDSLDESPLNEFPGQDRIQEATRS